jgi:hypothetical protein
MAHLELVIHVYIASPGVGVLLALVIYGRDI